MVLTNKNNNFNLIWITSPPIYEITPEKAETYVKCMKKSMEGWDVITLPENPTKDDYDLKDWKKVKRTHQERWNQRITATNEMLGHCFDDDAIFVYKFGKLPIGLLSLSNNFGEVPGVMALVTHPGSKTVGGYLIERAVQMSDKWGRQGKLMLCALNDDAQQAYRALGFKGKNKKTDTIMVLTPSTENSTWIKIGKLWRLKKNIDIKNGKYKPILNE